jgi:hypothetical protein
MISIDKSAARCRSCGIKTSIRDLDAIGQQQKRHHDGDGQEMFEHAAT